MKELFKISKEQLGNVIATLSNIASDKSPDINHSSIKINVGSKLQFICKNFETYVCKEYPCHNDTQDTFVVGIGIFSALAKKVDNTEITFFKNNDKLVLLDGRSTFTLDTILTSYPEREIANFQSLCTIDCKSFRDKIKLCLLKLDQGVHSLHFGEDSYFVVRDNRKLATVQLPSAKNLLINLSNNVVDEMMNICGLSQEIEILHTDKEIMFRAEGYYLISKNHWARSIDYLSLCNTEGFAQVNFKTQQMKKLLKKIKLMSPPLTNSMDLQFQQGGVCISVFNPSVGSAKEEIEIVHTINPMKIRLNISHLINVLELIQEEEFSFYVLDAKSKIIIKGEATYLLMPLSF